MDIAPSAVSSARPPSAPRTGRGAARPGARWLTLLVLIAMTATMLIQLSPMQFGQAASAAGSGPVNGTVKGTASYDRNNDGYYDGPTNSYQFIPDSGLGGLGLVLLGPRKHLADVWRPQEGEEVVLQTEVLGGRPGRICSIPVRRPS